MKKLSFILTLIIFTFAATAFAYTTLYVVNCRESITLREDPSVYSPEMAQIPLGEPVRFIEDVGNGFYKVNYEGLTGYALAEYLSSQAPTSARYGTVINCRKSITLRTAPSVHAEEIIQMPLGARVRFIDSAANDFFKVEYQGMVGYALRAYIELD